MTCPMLPRPSSCTSWNCWYHWWSSRSFTDTDSRCRSANSDRSSLSMGASPGGYTKKGLSLRIRFWLKAQVLRCSPIGLWPENCHCSTGLKAVLKRHLWNGVHVIRVKFVLILGPDKLVVNNVSIVRTILAVIRLCHTCSHPILNGTNSPKHAGPILTWNLRSHESAIWCLFKEHMTHGRYLLYTKTLQGE